MVSIAVEGCCHGSLNAIYGSLKRLPSLLIICGDFQAVRNEADLDTMSVPPKYRHMRDFHEYYSGAKKAPVLTIFIGGNHECSSYLKELEYGGWVAPNIYYLGEFGCVWYKGLKISGISGIWNPQSFFENDEQGELTLPYSGSIIRSIYHVKPKNFMKMYLQQNADIIVSHDWPQHIWKHGHIGLLIRKKPFFKKDIETGRLGSPINRVLLDKTRPRHWFSSHLHVKFEAIVKHKGGKVIPAEKSRVQNKDEINMDMDDMEETYENKEISQENKETSQDENKDEISLDMENTDEINLDMDNTDEINLDSDSQIKNEPAKPEPNSHTRFLALDKCLPGRKYLEQIEIEPVSLHISAHIDGLFYDARTIALNKVMESFDTKKALRNVSRNKLFQKPEEYLPFQELDELVSFEQSRVSDDLRIPENFKVLAPTSQMKPEGLRYYDNNQTKEYCDKFSIPYKTLQAHQS